MTKETTLKDGLTGQWSSFAVVFVALHGTIAVSKQAKLIAPIPSLFSKATGIVRRRLSASSLSLSIFGSTLSSNEQGRWGHDLAANIEQKRGIRLFCYAGTLHSRGGNHR